MPPRKRKAVLKKTYVFPSRGKKRKAQTGKTTKSADLKRKATKQGKRISKSGKTYWEYRRNRTDKDPKNYRRKT